MPIRILKEGVDAAKNIKEKKERDEKSRNPNPKTPTMMGEEKRKRFKRLLTGGQAKLDKNNNNRIDAEDFKILRGGKKPMKAALGAIALGLGAMGAKKLMKKKSGMATPGIGAAALIAKKKKEMLGKKKGGEMKKDPTKPVNPFEKRRKMLGGAGSAIGRAAKAGLKFGVAGAALGAAGAGAAMLGRKLGKKLDERKARKRDEAKVQKKSVGGAMKFGANILKAYKKAGRSKKDAKKMIEALKSPGAKKSYEIMRKATGKNLRGDESFEQIMKMKNKMGGGMMKRAEGGPAEKSETHKMFMKYGKKVPKKMGGGMMNKPMGYKSGGASVMARGCKLGRKKPTKMY